MKMTCKECGQDIKLHDECYWVEFGGRRWFGDNPVKEGSEYHAVEMCLYCHKTRTTINTLINGKWECEVLKLEDKK